MGGATANSATMRARRHVVGFVILAAMLATALAGCGEAGTPGGLAEEEEGAAPSHTDAADRRGADAPDAPDAAEDPFTEWDTTAAAAFAFADPDGYTFEGEVRWAITDPRTRIQHAPPGRAEVVVDRAVQVSAANTTEGRDATLAVPRVVLWTDQEFGEFSSVGGDEPPRRGCREQDDRPDLPAAEHWCYPLMQLPVEPGDDLSVPAGETVEVSGRDEWATEREETLADDIVAALERDAAIVGVAVEFPETHSVKHRDLALLFDRHGALLGVCETRHSGAYGGDQLDNCKPR